MTKSPISKKSPIKIHIVCTANVFRSRLAEMYLNSKKIPHIRAYSSGTKAERNGDGPISWYAARLAMKHRLVPYLSPQWTLTTEKLLRKAYLNIFMQPYHLEHVRLSFPNLKLNQEVWHIPDFVDLGISSHPYTWDEEVDRMKKTEEIYDNISEKVDDLINRLV